MLALLEARAFFRNEGGSLETICELADLDYEPLVTRSQGMAELAEWARDRKSAA